MGKNMSKVRRQKIIIIIMTILLVFALVIGITLAWFTDTATMEGTITLGSLNIKLQYHNGTEWVDTTGDSFINSAGVPGDTVIPSLRVIEGPNGINIPFFMRVKAKLTDPGKLLKDADFNPASSGWTASGGIYYYADGNTMNELTASDLNSGIVLYPNGIVIPTSVGNDGMNKITTVEIIVEVIQSKHLAGNTIADVEDILGPGEVLLDLDLNGGTEASTPLAIIKGEEEQQGKFMIEGDIPEVPAGMPTAEYYFFSDTMVTSNQDYFNNKSSMNIYNVGAWYDMPTRNTNFYAAYLEPTTWLDENGNYDHGTKTGDIVIANGPQIISGSLTIGEDMSSFTFIDFLGNELSLEFNPENPDDGAVDYSSITLPPSISVLGPCAFFRSAMSHIHMSNNVTDILTMTFYCCANLRNIELSSNLKFLGDANDIGGAFTFCLSLEKIVFPEGLQTIGGSTFAYCISLESVVIPKSVMLIGGAMFDQCYSLKEIYLGHEDDAIVSEGYIGGTCFRNTLSNAFVLYFKSESLMNYFQANITEYIDEVATLQLWV